MMRTLLLAALAVSLGLALAGAAHAQDAPPAAPSDVVADANGFPNQLYILWRNNAASDVSFRIERSTAGDAGPWTLVIEAPNGCILQAPTQCAYIDRDLVPETTYWYRIAAVNTAGMSAYSNVAAGVTVPLPTPEPNTIRGYVFQDANRNGMRDAGEEGLEHRLLTLKDGDVILQTGGSGTGGEYLFYDIPPGTHQLVADLSQSFGPSCGTFEFSYNPLQPASACQNVSFPWDGTTPTTVDVEAAGGTRVDFGAIAADAAVFTGFAILETERAPPGAHVIALFNGQECGSTTVVGEPYYDIAMSVLGAGERAGCPHTGDAVEFTIDGVPALDMLTYAPFSGVLGQLRFLNLVAMEQHAWYWFQFSGVFGEDLPLNGTFVQAVIDGVVCGEASIETTPLAGIAGFSKLIVPSADLQPGCGAPGAKVAFLFNGVPTGEPIEWRPGLQFINPLVGPVILPTAGYQPNGGNTMWPVKVTFIAAALLFGFGLALRRAAT